MRVGLELFLDAALSHFNVFLLLLKAKSLLVFLSLVAWPFSRFFLLFSFFFLSFDEQIVRLFLLLLLQPYLVELRLEVTHSLRYGLASRNNQIFVSYKNRVFDAYVSIGKIYKVILVLQFSVGLAEGLLRNSIHVSAPRSRANTFSRDTLARATPSALSRPSVFGG